MDMPTYAECVLANVLSALSAGEQMCVIHQNLVGSVDPSRQALHIRRLIFCFSCRNRIQKLQTLFSDAL